MGLFQLGLGAWISYITRSSPITEVTIQSFVAFGFPFTVRGFKDGGTRNMSTTGSNLAMVGTSHLFKDLCIFV
ncbi:hypothetical protein LWI29_035329 [Acer saccharum]|uniref:Uncharacterized protein n=1 Tax=Acer saccharum TaxID=4024 RepID=A0AA39W3N5_ACESA|nr:hypothetical protein LWI29_035329 [Acer saccharum]KAK1554360.1 hypothetical protein Q3G72_011130 [Acer saccharum]